MKKILVLLILVFSFYYGLAQPVVNRSGQANTVSDARLQAGLNFFVPRYSDTTSANVSVGIDSTGALIYTYNPSTYWRRDYNPKRWVEVGSGSNNGAIHGVYTNYGLTKINDSTLNFSTALRDSIIGLIPAQFNPIQGYNMLLTGSYPNITFTADTTTDPLHLATQGDITRATNALTLQNVITNGSTLNTNNTIVNGSNTLTFTNNGLTSNTGVAFSSNSTGAASNTQTVLSVSNSGANASSSQTTYGGRILNTKTGTSSTNIGLYAEASGGSTNYSGYFYNPAYFTNSSMGALIVTGGIPSNIYSTSPLIIAGGGNNSNQLYIDNYRTIFNANAAVGNYEFIVSADGENNLIFGGSNTTSYPSRVGINTATPVASLEIVTKYQSISTNAVFNALSLTGKGYGAYGAYQNGFGVGINMDAFNDDSLRKTIVKQEAVYTDVTSTSEDADFVLSSITNGSITEKLRLISTGRVKINNSYSLPALDGTSNQLLATNGLGSVDFKDAAIIDTSSGSHGDVVIWDGGSSFSIGSGGGGGTVTSVGFTGGLISVANPTTTPALTVAGTSGGIPYFSSSSTWTSSAALTANAIMIGGGAGSAPSTTTTASGILTWIGTPSSANLRSALTDENGTGVALFDAATSPSFTTSVTTASTAFALLNTTATTVNAFGAATTLNIGASAATVLNFGGASSAAEFRFLEPSGSGTNYTGFKAQAQSGNITYVLPASQTSGLLQNDGSGNLSWYSSPGSLSIQVDKTLDSLAWVRNDSTVKIKSLDIRVNNTSLSKVATTDSTLGYNMGINSTNLTFTGNTLNTIQNISTTSSPTFYDLTLTPNASNYGLFMGGTALITGLTLGTTISPTSAASVSVLTIGGTLTEYSSGTHTRLVGSEFTAPTITSGGATVTNAATVSIAGAPTGTFTNTAMSLWIRGGLSKFDGNVALGSVATIGTDTTNNKILAYNTSTGLVGYSPWNNGAGGGSGTHKYWQYQQWEHFTLPPQTTVNGSSLVHAGNSGTGSSFTTFNAPTLAGTFGVVTGTTGTTTTGWAALGSSNYPNVIGWFSTGSPMRFMTKCFIDNLRTSGEEYTVIVGFGDGVGNGAEPADGAYFIYSSANAAWQIKTASNGTRTTQTTSTTVATNTIYVLEVEWDGAGNMNYYINGSQVGTAITTNIPNTSGREFGIGAQITKSAGSTARNLYVDWMALGTDYN